MASQDDGFHEIQLNGKQLVFLFMAATVVSVVIFLCGVLVGRGVRAERSTADETVATPIADVAADRSSEKPAVERAPDKGAAQGSDPTTAPPPSPPTEDLTYFDRLEKQKPPAEQLKSPDKSAKGSTGTQDKKAQASGTDKNEAARQDRKSLSPAPGPRETATEPAEPAGQGFAVQIAALNVRTEAEAIAKRLSSKGYSAYVLAPPRGTPMVYRVRVGKFPTRREAESIAARLRKEEQFNPWITR